MQQSVGVHFAQAVHHLVEHPAHVTHREYFARVPRLARRSSFTTAMAQDQLLQAAALLEVHHQVDGVVGAKEVHHAHHVRVDDPRQRSPFLEEALQAVAVGRRVLAGDRGREFARCAPHQRARQVFLDRESTAFAVEREVDDREAAARDLSCDTIAADLEVFGKRCVGLRSHSGGVCLAALPRSEACPFHLEVSNIHRHRGQIRIDQKHDRLRVGHP